MFKFSPQGKVLMKKLVRPAESIAKAGSFGLLSSELKNLMEAP